MGDAAPSHSKPRMRVGCDGVETTTQPSIHALQKGINSLLFGPRAQPGQLPGRHEPLLLPTSLPRVCCPPACLSHRVTLLPEQANHRGGTDDTSSARAEPGACIAKVACQFPGGAVPSCLSKCSRLRPWKGSDEPRVRRRRLSRPPTPPMNAYTWVRAPDCVGCSWDGRAIEDADAETQTGPRSSCGEVSSWAA